MRVRVTKKGLIHAIAICTVCDWRSEEYCTAEKRAAGHVRETGHTVRMDTGYIYEYEAVPQSKGGRHGRRKESSL